MKVFGYSLTKEVRPEYPHKVGLALSGGGARGFAHAGAIKAMLEVGLVPDVVAGVSAGSVVAVMHASGIPSDEMVDMFVDMKFNDLCEWKVPKDGFFSLERFKEFLRKHIKYKRIEDLPLRTIVCATNFETGQKVAFEQGSIADCVAASCCIPIVFKPIVIDGDRYVDGGVLANLPAWAIREKCKFLVGINCSPAKNEFAKDNILDIAMRSYELMAKNNAVHDMGLCDMLVRTDGIAKYKAFDLTGIRSVYNNGYQATMRFFESKGVVPNPY